MEREILTDMIEKYRGVVFRAALGYIKNIHDADDIAQNVFVKLMEKNKTFLSEEEKKAWLIRVAINEAKNLLKSAWFKKRADLETLDESLANPAGDNFKLHDYIKGLKPKYRTVIFLHYYEGYTAKEIAGILKIPQSTVLTQLQRAREQLKIIITKEENYHGKSNTKLQGII
ncbi:MAG: RNA polymerase sigma factor [Oscillospiraceae bacterium]|nr:RNA polymerase sigma factor [Oscillospiraceae bacterium]